MPPAEFRDWPNAIHRPVPTAGRGSAVVSFPADGERVVRDGLEGPQRFTYIEVPAESDLPQYVVDCEVDASGSPRINSVHVQRRAGARDVLSEDLARVRSLEDVVETAWVGMLRKNLAVIGDSLEEVTAELERREGEQIAALRKQVRSLRKRPRSRVSDERLEEVARIYRENRGSNGTGKPTKAVGDELGLPPSTASWYVKRADEAGKDLGGPRG